MNMHFNIEFVLWCKCR